MSCNHPHAIAIIGMAFRFPGDHDEEQTFWEALKEGHDLVGEVPAERWATDELQHNRRGEPGRSISFSAGVLSRVDEFDAEFFGISPREAAWLDPQQRLLLELAWESMENAGQPPSQLAGSDCAVYLGISGLDYGTRGLDDLAALNAYLMTGNTLSVAANRLSYVFDLHGPSLAVDTACSSALVALHHACNALRTGEASTALAASVNLLLHPYPFIGFSQASMLSDDGRCKAFDADGRGYVRAEGGVVLLLKPLAQAQADGDDIQAVILASGANADGARKTGITIPSSAGQAELMRQVLARSGLSAHDVDFIEAHGTGTPVGDPVEAAAIGEVYGQGRIRPLPIGSVKTNLGHMEAAAGMAGLVKAVLALRHGALPPTLHLNTPNPDIDFDGLGLQPVTQYQAITRQGSAPLVAGVNAFGFGGANAHVLLQEYRPQPTTSGRLEGLPAPPLFLWARNHEALRALAGRYADFIETQPPEDYYDIAHAAVRTREPLPVRLALKADTPAEAVDWLRRHAAGATPEQVCVEDALAQGGEVAFVYSGNGAQWAGMGRDLLAESGRFAAILAELDMLMEPQAGFSVVRQLLADDEEGGASAALDDTTVAQPLLFAIQVAITTLLREAGLSPLAVTGHSVGEIAAAWASGALDLDQAIRVICARSQAQGSTRGRGRMAVVNLSPADLQTLLDEFSPPLAIELAAINSPENLTLSGSLSDLMRLQPLLAPRNIAFRLLDLDYAFHSREMDPIAGELAESLTDLVPISAWQARFVSTVTGEAADGHTLDADYWWRNIREPVQFSQAIGSLVDMGCRIFVEIGPHAILQRPIAECLAARDVEGRAIATLRRDQAGCSRIVETMLRVQVLAGKPQLQAWFPVDGRRVRLPNYPWQRESHWHPRTSEKLDVITRRRIHPLLGWRLPELEAVWHNTLDTVSLPWLSDHRVGDAVVYPAAAFAEMALAAAREVAAGAAGVATHEVAGLSPLVVQQMNIQAPMVFDGEQARSVQLDLNPADGSFRIRSRERLSDDDWTQHVTGRILQVDDGYEAETCIAPLEIQGEKAAPRETAPVETQPQAHYARARALGLDYGPAFQGLTGVRVAGDQLEARLALPPSLSVDLSVNDFVLHPVLLDVAFQTLINFSTENARGIALLPVSMGRLECSNNEQPAGTAPTTPTLLRAHLRHRGARSVLADFELFDANGTLLAVARDCRFRAAALRLPGQGGLSAWHIAPWLKPHPADGLTVNLPAWQALAGPAVAALANIESQRRAWFQETLPLGEALVLSFAFEACRKLVQMHGAQAWPQYLRGAYGQWLAALLEHEGILQRNQDLWTLVEDAGLPEAGDLWRTLLRDSPASQPSLTMVGRVGTHLAEILSGQRDGREFRRELQHSSSAETLYEDDTSTTGVHQVLRGILARLAEKRPASRRLRVLEIAAGPGTLPDVLVQSLPKDGFDYVLAQPCELARARLQAEYARHPGVIIAGLDAARWKLDADQDLPATYDVIILQHTLHRSNNPQGALVQCHRWLAAGGLLLIAERHPDWTAHFVEGLDPDWWRDANATSADGAKNGTTGTNGTQASPLLPPQVWQQALENEGFAEAGVFVESGTEGLAEGAYLVHARRPETAVAGQEGPEHALWLFLADEASAALANSMRIRLESREQCVRIADSVAPELRPAHVVHMLGWGDTPEQAAARLAALADTTRSLAAMPGSGVRLWLVTRGAQPAVTQSPANPAQAALWGFGRVLMNEHAALGCTLIELACAPDDPATSARLENELLRPDGSEEVLLDAGARYSLVLQPGKAPASSKPAEEATETTAAERRFKLDFLTPGQLDRLQWHADVQKPLGDGEIEVHVHATGLNFRDVMYVMGLLPDEAVENGFAGASLGLEFSGRVARVGARVDQLQPGDAVMGFGPACFASHVVTRASAVTLMPEGWRFESAAAAPTVFFTVHYALMHLAHLQPGERILIHGAAGGVGMAAIQLARHLGAEIYATAGNDEKRDFVALLGVDHVLDSRSLAFADDIMRLTNGEGVDVVLNSLAGEAMRRSLDVLRPFGRFIELGKRDFFENTALGLRPLKNNISYFGVDADALLLARPQLATRLFREVMTLFRDEALSPLPCRVFSAKRVVSAFRLMQKAGHLGKIVVRIADEQPALATPPAIPQPVQLGGQGDNQDNKQGAWLVTGGLSGFGLESARWLASRGVAHLVLVGRRGMDTPGAQEAVAALTEQGVQVDVQACDLGDAAAVQTLIAGLQKGAVPLKGILHAAAGYDDRAIAALDKDSLDAVLQAKLLGAWHLHTATVALALPLDYFVLYSSVTTAIGNPGQANYVAANTGLEGLAALRHQLGLPASCIAWGPIGDAGYLERNTAVRDSLAHRLGRPPSTAARALAELDWALEARVLAPRQTTPKTTPETTPILADFDWHRLAAVLPSANAGRFALLNRQRQAQPAVDDGFDLRTRLEHASPEEVSEVVHELVVGEVARILGINPERIEPHRALHDLGMDSLMAVELALGLEQRFGIQLPAMMLSDAPTTSKVVSRIVGRLTTDADDSQQQDDMGAIIAGEARRHGESLTDEEMESLARETDRRAQNGKQNDKPSGNQLGTDQQQGKRRKA